MGRSRGACIRRPRGLSPLGPERLEPRQLLVVGIDCGVVGRTIGDHVLGVNVPSWDYHLSNASDGGGVTPDARTVDMVRDAGLTMVRLSNGSGADEWHWASRHPSWPIGAGLLANFAAAAGSDALVNVNYGSGTPEEAAAYVAYLDGAVGDATSLGTDAAGTDWRTVGFWAALRAATPRATDDGYNHLRAGHPAAFGFRRFEIGNEAYFGAWRHWTTPDPVDYVTFARRFAALARAIEPGIQVGLGVGNPGEWDQAWNVPLLRACAAQGFTPGFLSDHFYVFDGARETLSDAALLQHTVSDPASTMPLHADSPRNWAGRARAYRELLERHLGGTEAAKVSLFCAEFNSDADSATKQSTSLVKGLFLADALGSVLATEYQGVAYWNLRNHYETKPADAGHYGWRLGADEGMLGTTGTPPATGPYVAYPAYFATQLAAKVIRPGGRVVGVTGTTADLAVYAVEQTDGHVTLLVVNKSPGTTLTDTFSFTGFVPAAGATLWQYGTAEDAAQRDSATGAASLTRAPVTIAATGGTFAFSFPAYSMSVLDLVPDAPAPNPDSIFRDGFENGWTDAGSWLAGRTIEGGVLRLHGRDAWEALQLDAPVTITPQPDDRLTFRAKGTGTWRVEGEMDGQDIVLGQAWTTYRVPLTAISTAPLSRIYLKNSIAGLDMDVDDVMIERGNGSGSPSTSFPTDPIPFEPGTPFTLTVGGTNHYVYVPKSYDATHNTPTTLFVWMHGCGGFSSGDVWTVSPGGDAQDWITLAPGGAEGGCWNIAGDGPKVLAAIAAVKTHFNIRPTGVILGGYSSGGDLGYSLAFYNAAQFAGLLAMNTAPFRDNGVPRAQAAKAAWKFNLLHVAHRQDFTYPIAIVRDEMSVLRNAGYPLELVEVDGTHWDDTNAIVAGRPVPGTLADIATYFFPKLRAGWSAPVMQNRPLVIERVQPQTLGVFRAGQRVRLLVTLSDAAQVRGRPQIELTFGQTIRRATYVSGSGSSVLAFDYVVRRRDTADLVSIGQRMVFSRRSAIVARAATIPTALPVGVVSAVVNGVRIDTTAPRVATDVQVPAGGTSSVGQTLEFGVRFTENVRVVGTPRISLTGLNAARQAAYISGTGTETLTFRYIVQAGDALRNRRRLGLVGAIAVPSGGTITDQAGNRAVLKITAPRMDDIRIRG